MLFPLRRRAEDAAPGDAVDALLDCHRRIRHFTAVAATLPDATATPEQIAAAAAGVARYFAEALPLHSADEEASIAPRILDLAPPEPLRAAIEAMKRQHVAIDALLASALPGWRAVAADPAALPAHAAALRDLAGRLATAWEEHLGIEEATIFPALRALLPAAEQDAVRAEMRARRGAG